MWKQKPVFNHPPEIKKSTPGAQKTTGHQQRNTRIILIGKTGVGKKTKLSPITSYLLTVSLRPRFSRKINVIEADKRAMQPLE